MRDRTIRIVLAFVAWVMLPGRAAGTSSLVGEDAVRIGSADASPALAGATTSTDDDAAPTHGSACSFCVAHSLDGAAVATLDVAAPYEPSVVPARLSSARPRAPPTLG